MKPNRNSPIPVYRQIADDLRRRIDTGEFDDTDRKLPSESALCEQYDSSHPTVRQALAELRTAGVVDAEHGRGVFVRRPITPILRATRLSRDERTAGRGTFMTDAAQAGFEPGSEVTVSTEVAGPRLAETFKIAPDAQVIARDRVMTADGVPVQLATSYLNAALAADAPQIVDANSGPGGIYARLEEAGYEIVRFTEHVIARMPTPAEAVALQISTGTPVLVITRTALAADRVLELNTIVMNADRFALLYEIPGTTH